jgi:hypothetical protein
MNQFPDLFLGVFQSSDTSGLCQYLSVISLPTPEVGFKMQLPERRIEQRRDATRAPTQGPK